MSQIILVIEDDPAISELIRCALTGYGYELHCFESGEEGLAWLGSNAADLVLLDIMLPRKNGIEILREIRGGKEYADLPVIMLTAKSGEIDKVTGLDAGANDYITKPFGIMELAARVRAALRNRPSAKSAILSCGKLVMNTEKHTVSVNGIPAELTLKEYELLKLLLQNAGKVLKREQLLNDIWGMDFAGETRTLDMHIRSLRQKIGDEADNPVYIQTVRGVGYGIHDNRL